MSETPARVTTPNEGRRAAAWDDARQIAAPLRLHRRRRPPEWMDYNDHMSESCFLLAFGDSADVFFRFIGIDEDYRAAGHSLYTTETHLHHRQEVSLGEPLVMTLQLLDHDHRRLHIYHEMRHGRDRRPDRHGRAAARPRRHGGRSLGGHARRTSTSTSRPSGGPTRALPQPAVVGHPIAIRHSK